MMNLDENKRIALDVSKAIMNGDWQKLDDLLVPEFTYSGDGMQFNKDQSLLSAYN